MPERRMERMPAMSLSVIQRIFMHESGCIGGLDGGPWLWPVRRDVTPPLRRPSPDNEICNQCGLCIDFCPQGAIFKAEKGVDIDYTYCKGCMICVNECITRAMKIIE